MGSGFDDDAHWVLPGMQVGWGYHEHLNKYEGRRGRDVMVWPGMGTGLQAGFIGGIGAP